MKTQLKTRPYRGQLFLLDTKDVTFKHFIRFSRLLFRHELVECIIKILPDLQFLMFVIQVYGKYIGSIL